MGNRANNQDQLLALSRTGVKTFCQRCKNKNFLRERQRFRPFLFVFADKSRETEENICYYSTTSQSFNPLLSLENSNARQDTFFLLATKANLWIDHVLRQITGRLTHSCSKYMIFKPSKSSFLPSSRHTKIPAYGQSPPIGWAVNARRLGIHCPQVWAFSYKG